MKTNPPPNPLSTIYRVAMLGRGKMTNFSLDQRFSSNETQILSHIYDTLFTQDRRGHISCRLAQSYHYDAITDVLKIQLGNHLFHDHTPIQANDVKHSLIQGFCNSGRMSNNEWEGHQIQLESHQITHTNNKEIFIYLKGTKVEDLLLELTKLPFAIRPQYFKKKGKLVGSGPYRLHRVSADGTEVELNRFAAHPLYDICVEQLLFKGYPTNDQTKRAFLLNEIDEFRHWGLSNEIVPTPKMLLLPSADQYVVLLQLNTESDIFKTLDQRRHFSVSFKKNIQQHSNYPWKINDSLVPEISLRNKSNQHLALNQKKSITIGVAHQRQKNMLLRTFSSEKMLRFGWNISVRVFNNYDELYLATEQNAIDATYLALKYHSQNKFNLPLILKDNHPRNLTKCKDPQLQLYLTQLYNNNQQQHILNKKHLFKQTLEHINEQSYVIPLGSFENTIILNKNNSIFCKVQPNFYTPQLMIQKTQDLIQDLYNQNQDLKKVSQKLEHVTLDSHLEQLLNQFEHDIKSPIGALKALTGQLTGIKLEQRDLLNLTLSRLEEFSNQFQIEMEKLKSNYHEPNHSTRVDKDRFSLVSLIQESIAEKKLEYSFQKTLSIDFSNSLSDDEYIVCNRSLLKDVVSNLINNAVESITHTQGNVSVHIKQLAHQKLAIEISDNGLGIDPLHLPHVCSLGFTTKPGGTGRGLHHASQTIKEWGGDLKIATQKTIGTKVTLIFPRVSIFGPQPEANAHTEIQAN